MFQPSILIAAPPLTFEDCLKEATEHNLDLQTAQRALKAAEDSHIASIGQFFPQISFSASMNRSGYGGANDALNGPSYSQNSSLSLNAQQDIFSGFKDFAAVDQANAQLDLAKAQLTQAKAQLSHDLKTDFYQLLYSQKLIDMLKTIADRQKANMDLVEMNFEGGTDNKGSYLQAQAAYQEALFEVDQAQRGLRVAQKQLDQVLGRGPMEDIEVTGDFTVSKLPDTMPDFLALTPQTPAYQEALAQLHLSESGYVTARSVFFPTLSANATLSRGGLNFIDNQPGWSAGLQLSLPLFTGGKDIFDLRSAEETKQGAKDTFQSTGLKTESNLESAYAAFSDALEQMQVLESQLTAAQVQEEIAKAEYLNGLMIFVNWNQIENQLTSQEKAELSGLLSEKTAEANWELTQGKGVIP
jgi:outer membrane protein TolC